ncbi:hypothetical protein F5Y03DRAFT_336569 [Xylaria venustula]|nr:hypothetical protein F5Y03DRAFT_336569 [Xylaria venustula]
MPPKRMAAKNGRIATARKRGRVAPEPAPVPVVAVDPYRPYRHVGVHIPFKNAAAPNQWSSDDRIQEEGFIFVKAIAEDAMVVQSVQTGRLFINKIIEPVQNVEGLSDVRKVEEQAEELRVSTAPNAEHILPRKLQVRGRERTYFVELQLWQTIADGVYSLYFDFYNGGTLVDLQQYYFDRRRPIPEHFIWHVLLTLIEDVRYLQTGCLPGEDNVPDNWVEIYHRDIGLNNIFIHYEERPASEREPPVGWYSNAFPEIVLGNFGHTSVEGDETRRITGGRWDRAQEEPLEWEDTWAIYDTIKMMSVSHMDTVRWEESANRPSLANSIRCDDINRKIDWPNDSRYSDDLINTLKLWEYRNFYQSDIHEEQINEHGVATPNWILIPTMYDLIQNVLPLARRMVRKYSTVPRNDPLLAQQWYRRLDVSWTKPTLMPYRWMPKRTDRLDETILRNIIHDDQDGGDGRGSGIDEDGDAGDDNVSEATNGGITGSTESVSGLPTTPPGDTTGDNRADTPIEQHYSSPSSSSDGGPDKGDRSGIDPTSDKPFSNDDDALSGDIIPSGDESNGDRRNEDESDDGGQNGDDEDPNSPPFTIETIRAEINPILVIESVYPDFREPCRLVMLEYRLPLVLDIRNVPDPPYPRGPKSPPASEDHSDSNDSDDITNGNDNAPGDGGDGNDGGGPKKPPPTRQQPTRQQPLRQTRFKGNYKDLIRNISRTTEKLNPNTKKLLLRVYTIVEAEQARLQKSSDTEIPKKRKFFGEDQTQDNKRRGTRRSRRARGGSLIVV